MRRLAYPTTQTNFNPRSPYGERPTSSTKRTELGDFNPRSPYGERLMDRGPLRRAYKFQSTLPLRGATFALCCFSFKFADFNPRSPYGERLMCNRSNGTLDIFQSTLPLRGATGVAPKVKPGDAISIHAPLTGSDSALSEYRRVMLYFNPRSP